MKRLALLLTLTLAACSCTEGLPHNCGDAEAMCLAGADPACNVCQCYRVCTNAKLGLAQPGDVCEWGP